MKILRVGCMFVGFLSLVLSLSAQTFTTLHSFDYTDGAFPVAPLVQATNAGLYGTTEFGANGCGEYSSGCGTVFKITPHGTLTTLYSFVFQDGAYPYAGLVQATNGSFYGTTSSGGANGAGTVFKITTKGMLTTLYTFCSQSSCTDGENPYAGLVEATNGNFYGTTEYGGAKEGCGNYFDHRPCGTVFSLSVGLGPFVETQPTFGKVGTAVKILGTDLTGATSITFNGTAAKFNVVSKSEITTTVPEGATTGKVKVTTPEGTLKSNVVFRVAK